ncbi:hypothetical protein [Bradyrhizobium sp. Leo121]|uniref:hypothetical protein n=1 Tax=Bradyrhizobium sp. Leo121 TaxID=1571195 RepID=UPI00102A380F|nr:hypothetical protein [Bradyrhizobium sp. Leo121]
MLYPLVPWIGVMAAGYALWPLFELEQDARRRWFATLGIVTLAGFIALRASNLHGDPRPWLMQSSWLPTLLSFLDCEKYPPSLLYRAMTLGPAFLVPALFERARGTVAGFIITYGRVPFIYYVVHIFLIHAAAVVLAWVQCGTASFLIQHGPGCAALDLWPKPCGRLRHLALGGRSSLSTLPLVRRSQTTPFRLVAELSLSRSLKGKRFGCGDQPATREDAASELRCVSRRLEPANRRRERMGF